MIVREIKDAGPEFFESFDYFNDYKDTRAWAKHNCPEKLVELDKGDIKSGWRLTSLQKNNEVGDYMLISNPGPSLGQTWRI